MISGFLMFCLVLMLGVLLKTPSLRGDGNEYVQMVVSFSRHAGPDLQEGDSDVYNLLRKKSSLTLNPYPTPGFFSTASGELYSYHFWLYPLFALPAYMFLQISGLNVFRAFEVTNYLMFVCAIALILFYSGFSTRQKLLFSALLILSPVPWYLLWPSPEIFSCSLIVASIAFFTRKNYYPAILFASIAATQNAPIIILTIYFIIYAVIGILRSKKYTGVPLLLACSLPAFLPSIFYLVKYGSPNLIYKTGYASFDAISFKKTFDFFFDLNMGMLPYLPFVLTFCVFLLLYSWKRGRRAIYELLIVILAMVLLAETTLNWNSDAGGVMRYAVWIIPLVIWGIIESLDFSHRIDRVFISLALVSQLVISVPIIFFYVPYYTEHNILARYVLDNYPYLYSPEPETFAERTLGREGGYANDLPVVYCNGDGYATKILTDYFKLEQLEKYLDVDQKFLTEQIIQHQSETGVFYVNAAHREMHCMKGSNERA